MVSVDVCVYMYSSVCALLCIGVLSASFRSVVEVGETSAGGIVRFGTASG